MISCAVIFLYLNGAQFQGLQVKSFCQKYGFPNDFEAMFKRDHPVLQEFLRHLIFSDEKELILCFIPKVQTFCVGVYLVLL